MNKTSGFFAMIATTLVWGNFLLVFSHINYIPPIDIIAHRILWGLVTLLIWLAIKGRLGEVSTALKNPKIVASLFMAAIFVMMNWLGFVWAAGNGHGYEAGLGYFIYPLVSIGFGAIFNKERLDRVQLAAILIAAIGVSVLAFGLGRLPWISILLAVSFAFYGLIKSRVAVGAVISVAVENILLAPLAIIWLLVFAQFGLNFGESLDAGFWLIAAGSLTALALIGFSYATKTIGMVATGMLFFINPTVQVLNAAIVLGEPLTIYHVIAFPIIWLACGVYCYDLWKTGRRRAALAKVTA